MGFVYVDWSQSTMTLSELYTFHQPQKKERFNSFALICLLEL